MTGKTHTAVGIAAALYTTRPDSVRDMVFCMAVASVGAVISDIDVSTSESRKDINRVIALIMASAIITVIIEYTFSLGIADILSNNRDTKRLIAGIAMAIIICIYGQHQPHRTFMHSLLGVTLLSISVYLIEPLAMPCFTSAMLSHIIIDTLNHKKVHLLYPLKGGFCMSICYASGVINNAIFLAGALASAMYMITNLLDLL